MVNRIPAGLTVAGQRSTGAVEMHEAVGTLRFASSSAGGTCNRSTGVSSGRRLRLIRDAGRSSGSSSC